MFGAVYKANDTVNKGSSFGLNQRGFNLRACVSSFQTDSRLLFIKFITAVSIISLCRKGKAGYLAKESETLRCCNLISFNVQ